MGSVSSFMIVNVGLSLVSLAATSDPNYKNVFYQTSIKEVQNEELTVETGGAVPEWLNGDFVRQNCASFGDIDGEVVLLHSPSPSMLCPDTVSPVSA